MRFWIILLFIVALPAPAEAQSAGVALRWDKCYGEGIGPTVRTFACDTNAGRDRLVGSFMTGTDLPEVTGLEIALDLSTAPLFSDGGVGGPPIPAWWTFKTAGSCRPSALQLDVTPDAANQVCRAWSEGQLLGAIATYTVGQYGPTTARLLMGVAAGSEALGSVVAGMEYSGFTLNISHVSSVGSASCSGCQMAMILILNSIKVATPPVFGQPTADITLWGPLNATDSDFAIWQGNPVPTRMTTWGAVKSLYH